VSGNLTATSSSAVASFTSPASLTLGGHVYTVSTPSLNLGATGTPQQTLMANITVANAPTGTPTTPSTPSTPSTPPVTPHAVTPGPSATPEPASLVRRLGVVSARRRRLVETPPPPETARRVRKGPREG
jgi:hypothetical protein